MNYIDLSLFADKELVCIIKIAKTLKQIPFLTFKLLLYIGVLHTTLFHIKICFNLI